MSRIYRCVQCTEPCTLIISSRCDKPSECPYPGPMPPVWKRMRVRGNEVDA